MFTRQVPSSSVRTGRIPVYSLVQTKTHRKLTQKCQSSVRCNRILGRFKLERKYRLFYDLILTSLVQFVLLRRNAYLLDSTRVFSSFRYQNTVNRGFRDSEPCIGQGNCPGLVILPNFGVRLRQFFSGFSGLCSLDNEEHPP